MAMFSIKDSSEFYLALSNEPKRFDADSPFTNVFFDDTNGQVFTVRSGGPTDRHIGVTVSGIDDSKSTSFRIEDKGAIIYIKFSLDYKILAIQRNQNSQNAAVDFINFKDLAPTNVEYSHTCKWKNAKILGFVWPKINEIAFITDYGIELLQVLPEKKQLKSLKSTSFSGAWFSWCSKSNVVVLAGNNGALLQPFALNNSTITKLQKLEYDLLFHVVNFTVESARPVVERDVFVIRVSEATWCAIFRHCNNNNNPPSPTEVWLMPISGAHVTHILKTGQAGRFAVSVVDDLIIVHHQASQTSQVFDIMEESSFENNTTIHVPVVTGNSIKPAVLDDMPCPMYSDNWIVFQPQYIIDARLGCLWTLQLLLDGLANSVPKDEIHKIVSVLLRRSNGHDTVYKILNQMIAEAGTYLAELSKVFDEVNVVYRRWAEQEVSRITAGVTTDKLQEPKVVISQTDMCSRVLHKHAENKLIVQVVTAYIASLCRNSLVVQSSTGEACVRSLVTNNASSRLRSLVRRGALGDSRPLACQLLSLGAPPADQLAVDMLRRTGAHEEIVEVLLSWNDPVSAIGYAKQAGNKVWNSIPARKLLSATQNNPADFVTTCRALMARNEKIRGSTAFLKDEHCEGFMELYKQLTTE